ncbi:sulfatase-like hydrolase/transferase [Flavobacterium granuli]|uniref:Arylsulfatase A n=1 Tax=Flavobacterium granuli TaxID=280093 RepID=A0A1M5IWL3_9FLAO|nr:sulfatase-like hydrolase/transferase [Flavobacterium granuli]PRZ28140.1 arylsulfatase A-like enzyme [Flavobacterium granuli]SHG32738.1 Arylsulfatase A [Flavobacterium granuli]
MRKIFSVILITCFALKGISQEKPNIIYILVDDMGYGDIGVFFQNQRMKTNDRSKPYQITPYLDQMAASGAIFTQQYCNAPVCAPSRGSLLTGVNQGNAHVRDNQFDKALEDNHTLATVLKQASYQTMAIGKWGLQGVEETGPDWPSHPLKRGFDSYYGYMRHMDGHEHYPFEGLYRGKKEVYDNYKNVAEGLAKCYTTDLWTAVAKKQIIDHVKGKEASKPFFMYLAYDAPHAVLELPTQDYPKGKGLNGGLQWTGKSGQMINTASGVPDSFVYPEYADATYDDDNNPATKEVAWPDTYKRYATANRRIDDGVGDILQLLKDLKIDENTLVVFSSDNGASIESYLPAAFVGFQPTFFASNATFEGIKRDVLEGGVRMPVLANWPKHIAAGKVITTPSMLSDWMATFAEMAGIPAPARTDGVSLLPSLTAKGKQQKSLVYVEYQGEGKTPNFKEFNPAHRDKKRGQMQLIRMGDYKGVRYDIKSAEDDFEIYDVVKDPQEINNLALKAGFEKMQKQMKASVLQLRQADAEAPRPYDNAFIPAATVSTKLSSGLIQQFFEGDFPWVVSEKGLKAKKQALGKSINTALEANKNGMVLYTGFIKIPSDGKYNFSFQTSGKAYMRLHEASLFDADFGYQPTKELTKEVSLKAGYHPVSIYLLQNSDVTNSTTIKWKAASAEDWKVLEANDLYYSKK